ncbi:PREDICTED: zinc finger and BTB domain-containing protein 17-like [Branchiostoma belcheri]|uniref:Zinc finger and BTB domain-containing protein 17-like n=1 Tax=Branchiostoma belcheri TaxID=7741 RepID=A0A6P4Z7S2_BRABE|nr:PREDICTED: zinc finger and BTB domain-containing protein 17-like [Branchiostoma belcheri]
MALPPGYADSVHEYPNHADQLLQHLHDLRKDSRLHDVILKLADGEWRAHKCVLSAFSGFFRSLFVTSGSREREVKLKTVTCKGIGPLLEYMYTGKLELVEENVMEVFCTAGYLQVFNVLSDISKFLSNTTLSTQQGRQGSDLTCSLACDSMEQEEMYNQQSVCDPASLQQELRSQSPDSGTQSGEEFRVDEEMVTSLSGNNFDILAAQMSQMTADAFAQVLSLDLAFNTNGENSTLVNPEVITDANGLPSMVVLDQGKVEQVHVEQSGLAMQVNDISVEGEASMEETQGSASDTHQQLDVLSTQDSPQPSVEGTSHASVVDCPVQQKDIMLQEAAEKVSSSVHPSDITTADEVELRARTPISDVGTAGDVDSFSSEGKEEGGTAAGNEMPANLDEEEASSPQSVPKEGEVENQAKFQNVTEQSADVDKDGSPMPMQAGDVQSEPKTLETDDKNETTVAPQTDKNETTVAPQTDGTKNVRQKRKAVRKSNNATGKRTRKTTSESHVCSVCDEVFQSSKKLQTHVAKDHGTQTQQDSDRSEAVQTGEGSSKPGIKQWTVQDGSVVAGTNELTVLPENIQAKEGEPTQKGPAKNNNVAAGKRRRKLMNDPYKCNICGEELQSCGKLRTHLANHEGGKKHECPVCSAKFGYSNHLADHMRIHTGERPYKCTHCDANFKQKSTLIRHTRRHTGQMPYRCAVCNLGFHDTTHLKLHQKTHTKVRKETVDEFTVTVLAEGSTIDASCLLTEGSIDASCFELTDVLSC